MQAGCGKKRRSSSSSISVYVLERVSAFMGNAIFSVFVQSLQF